MNFFGIHFMNQQELIWGIGVVAFAILLYRSVLWRRSVFAKLQFRPGIAFVPPRMRPIKNILNLLGVVFVWIALLGPQWGQKEVALTESGLDLCMTIDISKSMLAEDLRPNRLEAVKNQLPLFFNELSGDRVALTAFAGSAFIASPLTADYSALTAIVDPLASDFISDQSTNLSTGIDACLSALKLDKITSREELAGDASKVILIVSDGGNTSDEESAPVERAKALGVPIYVMAVGTAQGSYIPIRDERGVQYIVDPRNPNQPLLSKLEEKPLQAIAASTGGKIFYASSGNQAWISFKKELDNFQREAKESGAKRNLEDRFQIPLLLGFIFLFADWLLSETKVFAIWVLILLVPQPGYSKGFFEKGEDPEVFWETYQGLNKFKEKKFDESQKHFNQALESGELRWIPRYNWATGKIFLSLPKDAGEVKKRQKDVPKTLLEAERELEALLADMPNTPSETRKIALYQLAWVKWLKSERVQALRLFYESLNSTEIKELDEATKTNITLLLIQMSQGGGGGGGGESQEGEGEEGDQKNKVGQGQGEKPKFSGTDVDEKQADKILESVGNKELETMKKKSRGEARDREINQKGEKGGRSSGKDPQW